MSKKEIDKKIAEITDKIVKEFKPEKIILFGSYAWGKPNKDSDIDLLVDFLPGSTLLDQVGLIDAL